MDTYVNIVCMYVHTNHKWITIFIMYLFKPIWPENEFIIMHVSHTYHFLKYAMRTCVQYVYMHIPVAKDWPESRICMQGSIV